MGLRYFLGEGLRNFRGGGGLRDFFGEGLRNFRGVEKFSRGWLKNFRGVEIFSGGVEIFRSGLEPSTKFSDFF